MQGAKIFNRTKRRKQSKTEEERRKMENKKEKHWIAEVTLPRWSISVVVLPMIVIALRSENSFNSIRCGLLLFRFIFLWLLFLLNISSSFHRLLLSNRYKTHLHHICKK